jgi:hypothetical protein
MLRQMSIFHPQNVRGYPCPRAAVSTESPVQHHTVALRQYEGVLVTQRVRQTADEAEQTVSPRRYVGAVLDVGFRPKLRRFRIIAPVEKRIECLQNIALVFSADMIFAPQRDSNDNTSARELLASSFVSQSLQFRGYRRLEFEDLGSILEPKPQRSILFVGEG